MASLLGIAYAGALVVLLSAVSYVASLALPERTASAIPVLVFLGANVLSWGLGALLRSRGGGGEIANALLALGDGLLPLNICAAAQVWGGVPVGSPLTMLAAGVSFLALALLRIVRGAGLDSGYPYFLAAAGTLLVNLGRITQGLAAEAVLWLLLGLSLVVSEVFARLAAERGRHFRLAALGVAFVATLVAAAHCWPMPSRDVLQALAGLAVVLAYWAARSRDLGAVCRFFGFAAYCAVTLLITASLVYSAVSPTFLLAATAAWILVLTLTGILLRLDATEPFRESAHWLAFLLAVGLAALSLPAWWPLRGVQWSALADPRHGPESPWRSPMTQLVAALSLAAVSAGLTVLASWRRRHPPIAFSMAGLVANLALLNAASFLAPIVALVAVGRFSAGIPSLARVAPLALVVLGALYLSGARVVRSAYSEPALRAAGYLAMVLAAYVSLGQPRFVLLLLFVVAVLFLWRSMYERALGPHFGFLAAMTGLALLVARPVGRPAGLGLTAVTLALLAVYRVLSVREGPSDRANVTAGAAVASGVAAVVVILSSSPGAWALPFVLWAAIPLLLSGERERGERPVYEPVVFIGEWMETLAWTVAHAAGAVALILVWRQQGFAAGDAGVVVAAWAWLHATAHRWLLGRFPGRPVTVATGVAAYCGVVVSIVLPVFSTSRLLTVASLLLNAALLFAFAPPSNAGGGRYWRFGGSALSALAIVVAAFTGRGATAASLAGVALIFLGRSLRERSRYTHAVFLVLATVAAGLATGTSGWAGPPVIVLALVLLAVGRAIEAREGRSARGRLTLGWALAAGAVAVAAAVVAARPSPEGQAVLWLAFLVGWAGWERRPEDVGGRPDAPEDRWLSGAGLWLGHIAGAVAILAAARVWGLGLGGAAAALAAWAWVHLLIAGRAMPASEGAVGRTSRRAVHAIAGLALILASLREARGELGVIACVLVALLYLYMRRSWRRRESDHAAALAAIEGIWLWGLLRQVSVPEYYLAPIGAYLYVVLLGERVGPAAAPARGARSVYGMRLTRSGLLGLVVLLLTVVYPFWALIRSEQEIHLFFLGGAAVALLFAALLTRRSLGLPGWAWGVFVAGTVWLLLVGETGLRLATFLAGAGLLVLAGLVLVGPARSRPWRAREMRA